MNFHYETPACKDIVYNQPFFMIPFDLVFLKGNTILNCLLQVIRKLTEVGDRLLGDDVSQGK